MFDSLWIGLIFVSVFSVTGFIIPTVLSDLGKNTNIQSTVAIGSYRIKIKYVLGSIFSALLSMGIYLLLRSNG